MSAKTFFDSNPKKTTISFRMKNVIRKQNLKPNKILRLCEYVSRHDSRRNQLMQLMVVHTFVVSHMLTHKKFNRREM